MTMRATITGTIILAGMLSQASAQEKAEPRRLQVRPLGGAAVPGQGFYGAPALDLTDKQKAALAELSANQSKTITAIFQNKELTPAQRSEQYTALQKEYQQKVNEVYTPEQREKLAKFQEEQRIRAQEQTKKWTEFSTKGGFPGMLGLTDEQKAKWAAAEKDQQDAMRKLQDALMAQQRELQEGMRAKQREVLTEEQRKQFDTLLKDFPYATGWSGGGGGAIIRPQLVAPKKN